MWDDPQRSSVPSGLCSGNLWCIVNVRPYEPRDIAVIARLFTETVRSIDTGDYSPEQLAVWAPDPPDIEHWRRWLSERIVFVAENDSEIVGFATFEPDGHLDYIYAHRRFQRKGVASALFQCIEQEAISRGLTRIFAEASITARPFFESVGFRLIASQRIEQRGIPFINYRMEKFLSQIK
jgi:GNAT superfamily N-acetyltransferase